MNVLIIGSGGREHALAWKAAQDPRVQTVFVAPGNAGTATELKCRNIEIDILSIEQLADFAEKNVSLTLVGPEAPLVAGIVDLFTDRGLHCFGPKSYAAQLEGSKYFAKEFMLRHAIPTAAYANFTELEPALTYIREIGAPLVIKADGLASGKGVVVAMTLNEDNLFGAAGARIVIEEFLEGEETSFIVMADGENILPLASSQDHKRAYDHDTGPNTGGMGAYSPAPVVTTAVHQRIMTEVIYPAIKGMSDEGTPYTGFLYAGLMIDKHGNPKVIEFNCRLGDPETQPIMLRLESSLILLMEAAQAKALNKIEAQWDPRPSIGVVMAAKGYPNSPTKGDEIQGLPISNSSLENDSKVFHAGTALNSDKKEITSGGRVLCVTALGEDILEAQKRAYQLTQKIHWNGCFFRTDIGYLAINRTKSKN
ncbi:UNVERIFIED_CONTAM: hypothetical protein GTU68_052101 [Idotea baltica]|nr:hypothetical protein [Idotea baltica]